MRLTCRVHPRAAHEGVSWDGGVLAVRVHPPAVDGEANRAVVRAIARWLDVAPSRVSIVGGTRSRTKVVDVEGLDAMPAGRDPQEGSTAG